MKVTLERASLLKSLGHVHRVVERRNTIPILSNVLLHIADGAVAFKATDLDMEVSETVPAEIAQAGGVTAPAHTLYEIVRKLPEGSQVTFESTGESGQMTLRSGRSRFTLSTLPESDFPDLSVGEMPHRFEVAATVLKRLFDKTHFAISTEETRYYLNGVFLHEMSGSNGSVLRAVATDGHRLARVETEAPQGAAGMPSVIVPRKAVAEIQKLLEDQAGDLTVELSATKIRLSVGPVVLTSKLIDGTFPDYQRVIPSGNDRTLLVDKEAFARAVDRVSTISSERGRAVKLSLASGRVTLSVTNPDAGSATEELEAEYDSPPLDIGFNARYLLDVLGQLDGENALLKLAEPGSPTLMLEREGASTLYVLMPMRV
jgi:DNA polymerase III subunit beta